MSPGNTPPPPRPEQGPPPTDKRKMALAGVLLVIPVIAMLWVPHYATVEPRLFGFPFFFWYQLLWVFLCSAMTYAAFRLTLSARSRTTHEVGADR